MKIELPYKPKLCKITTDSLSDFYIVLGQVVNFYQESLMMYSVTRDSIIPKLIPERKGTAYGYIKYTIPSIQIDKRDEFHSDIYPIRLFQNTIVNIASVYEIYLRELAEEIYRYNIDLLKVDEKQLTTKEILEFEKIDDIKEELIDKSVTKLVMNNYPNLVKNMKTDFILECTVKKHSSHYTRHIIS